VCPRATRRTWGYGTGWEAVRGLLGSTSLSPQAANAAHGAPATATGIAYELLS